MEQSSAAIPSSTRLDRLWRAFATPGRAPHREIREAVDNWEALAPAFLDRLQAYVKDPRGRANDIDSLAVVIHLCGQMREQRAYRPLVALVSLPGGVAEEMLGDGITETLNMIVASVYDGDPRPMQEAVLDPRVDEYAANALIEAHTFLTGEGRISMSETRQFLERCHAGFRRSEQDCVRWHAWQQAVSYLALTEYVPQVREIFEQGWIPDVHSNYAHFEANLAKSLEARARDEPLQVPYFGYFENAEKDISAWYYFSPEYLRDLEQAEREAQLRQLVAERERQAAVWRHTGRNDPCPCGSGRKYKKCCLGVGVPA